MHRLVHKFKLYHLNYPAFYLTREVFVFLLRPLARKLPKKKMFVQQQQVIGIIVANPMQEVSFIVSSIVKIIRTYLMLPKQGLMIGFVIVNRIGKLDRTFT